MSPGCPKRKIFISEISIQRSGKGKGGDSELCRRKGKEIFCWEGGFWCGAHLLPPRYVGSLQTSEPLAERPGGYACTCFSSSGTRHPAGQGRAAQAGSARQAPALSGVPPAVSPLPRKSPGVGEGRRVFFFYLRRGAASGREGKVQAAGGRAPLSPMEGV